MIYKQFKIHPHNHTLSLDSILITFMNIERYTFIILPNCLLIFIFLFSYLIQVQIVVTITTGVPNYLLDLTAIRLASLNQTLDPWLYILLRKSFITKIKQYCKRICCNCTSLSNDSDDTYDQNAHAHHLRCFRKHYNVAAGQQYMCHFKNVPPAAMCMNMQHKRSSKSKSSDKDSKQKKLSLPDVMKDTESKTPLDTRPDIADLDNYEEICKQCQSIHARRESKSTFSGDGAYVNVILMAKSDNSNTSDDDSDKSSTSQHCNICSGVDDSQFNEVFSDAGPETLESELFLTKTTASSHDELDALSNTAANINRRKHLKSEVIPSPQQLRLSR